MENTELAVKNEEIQSLVVKTNEALTLNQTSVERAKEAGLDLIKEIETAGMSDPMDEKANGILVKMRKTGEAMLNRRKPVTQLFDQIKKVFTALESDLDPKKENSVYAQIQTFRDDYAAKKAAEAEALRKEAERKLAIENEKTEVKSKIELALNEYFEEYLQEAIDFITEIFNNTTIKDFKPQSEEISGFPTVYPREHYDKFTQSVRVVYIDSKTITTIIDETKSDETFTKFSDLYENTIGDVKLDLVEKLPGKLEELKAIAAAEKKDKEEAARLKKAAEEREAADKAKQLKEAEERKAAAALEAEQKKETGKMQNIFDATPTETVNTAQVRTGFEITITHQKGWLEIFNFWFLKEGFDQSIDAMGRKSLDSMKTFCQNYAAKEGEQIKSTYLKYKETFKAVAKA